MSMDSMTAWELRELYEYYEGVADYCGALAVALHGRWVQAARAELLAILDADLQARERDEAAGRVRPC